MSNYHLLLLAGDGIGPEVMAEVKKLIELFNKKGLGQFSFDEGLVGGASYDADKVSITDATMAKAESADAVIFGAGRLDPDSRPMASRPISIGNTGWNGFSAPRTRPSTVTAARNTTVTTKTIFKAGMNFRITPSN